MERRLPIIERAFALAQSGSCQQVRDIRVFLKVEGYASIDDFIAGKALVSKLKQLCATACFIGPIAST